VFEPKTADFLSSPAVWAIFISHFAINFGFFISLGWLPKYFSSLGVDFANLGFISFLPYLSQFVSAICAGLGSDFCINRFKISTNVMRKTMNTVSALGSAFCFLLMIFVTNVVVLIILSIFAIAFLGISKAGYWVNVIDIAPKHAGLILGISNTMATIPGILGNIITGAMLDYFGGSWTPVFILIITTDIIGGVAFLLLSKGEPIFK
jgi:MFS family permease